MTKRKLLSITTVVLVVVSGCFDQNQDAKPRVVTIPQYTYAKPVAKAVPLQQPMILVEPAASLGIDFVHHTGAAGKKLMPETMGPGCALFDYDGDGRLDAMFTDGRDWAESTSQPMVRLYRNGGEKFVEVTHSVGLDAISGYGMGLAIADYDADGDADVLVTTVTGSHLLRNDHGVYTDVTTTAGLSLERPEWATSAAWLDADGDGRLDLFIANYVQWSPNTDVFTTLDGTNKSYATPKVYPGLDNRLWHNIGNGHFVDISNTSGLVSGENKALGVVVLDANGDWIPDIFVSNDTVANKLYINNGKRLFSDEALNVGVGYDELGQARAGMGVDTGEAVGGATMIGIGNFSDEAVTLYEQIGAKMVFIDAAQKRGIATKTLSRLTFGTRFADLNNDGHDDLILINGHIDPDIQKVQNAVAYQQPIDIFIAQDNGRFASLEELTGKPVSKPIVGRCLAVGDIDGDGDLDGLVAINGGTPLILRNTTGGARAIEFDLYHANNANIEALGAFITVTGKNWERRQMVRARGSYLGHSPYTLHFGIPQSAGDAIAVTVRWPDAVIEQLGPVHPGQHYLISRSGNTSTLQPK